MRSRIPRLPAIVCTTLLVLSACGPRIISGTITDRNGEPIERALVAVSPGNVEVITDQAGLFQVDYLRNEIGERTKLSTRTDYQIEIFKPGYHLERTPIYYKRGELLMEPITLREDTIRVLGNDSNIDPDLHQDRTHSAGANYEGE